MAEASEVSQGSEAVVSGESEDSVDGVGEVSGRFVGRELAVASGVFRSFDDSGVAESEADGYVAALGCTAFQFPCNNLGRWTGPYKHEGRT